MNQAQRLEAVGHLTGGVAHDFNNLLTVVVGNATLLQDEAAGERTRGRAMAILNIAERGERLTRQLLAFSRRQTLRPEPVALQGRAGDIGELLSRCLRENIEVTVDLPSDLWPVEIDPGEFGLTLLNIAVNARDAMPDAGRLRIWRRTGASTIDRQTSALPAISSPSLCRTPERACRLTVKARAFEPYFTTKGVGLGSGLGLCQVYGFAKQSGGTAVIASEPGKGTAITLFCPVPTSAQGSCIRRRSSSHRSRGRVLLVEDDAEVAEATEEFLRNIGFEARRAPDGKAALALSRARRPVDLVYRTVVMPGGVSGLDLARVLRQRRPAMPVILATGYSQYAPQVIGEGFTLIEKPYQRDGLAAALRSVLEHPSQPA